MTVECDQFVGNDRKKSRSRCLSPARFRVSNENSYGDPIDGSNSCEYHLFQAVKRLPGDNHIVENI